MKKTKEEVMQMVEEFVRLRSLKQNTEEFKEKGVNTVECEFHSAINERYPNVIFVFCDTIVFHSHKLEDKFYGLFAFDKNTGEFLKNFDYKNIYRGFYQDLKEVNRIL